MEHDWVDVRTIRPANGSEIRIDSNGGKDGGIPERGKDTLEGQVARQVDLPGRPILETHAQSKLTQVNNLPIVDVKASDFAGRRFTIEMQATDRGLR